MRKIFSQINLILFTLGAVLLLCSIFNARAELAYGMIAGKIYMFRYALLFFAGCVLVMELTSAKRKFTFSLPDGLLLILFGSTLLSYDTELNLQPEKILFLGQITLLWFMLRGALQLVPALRIIILSILLLMGIFAAIWGLVHFYGRSSDDPSLFSEIEFAFDANLLAGYLAVILPICINLLIRLRYYWKAAIWKTGTEFYYLAWIALALIVFAMIACGNHPAWIAALLASAWVAWVQLTGWGKTKRILLQHRLLFGIVLLVLVVSATTLPQIGKIWKTGTTEQHTLVWKVATKAICEHPFTGGGLGRYPALYAHAQAAYFASGEASDEEKTGAGYPAFVSNEYLHIGLELGMIGLVLFLLWMGFSLYYGIRHRQTGACGGILSLAILSLYAYPLQLPSFWILLIFLSAMCVTPVANTHRYPQKSVPYIGALAAIVYCILCLIQKDSYPAYREWKTLQTLYAKGQYRIAAQGYTCLYPDLCHRSEFLKEGAACLCQTGQYQQADQWIERALLLSADPELYYLKAEAKKRMKQYREAEVCLQEIIGILPERSESYFRLARLYADSAYRQPEKLKKTIWCITRKQIQHGLKAKP